MPALPPDALRVLITGYGPFRGYPVNPSWQAVRPLHNATVHTPSSTAPRAIHITALEVSTSYAAVLRIVPALHARPPVLPPAADAPPPPADGYDLVVHVGVAGGAPGLRLEQRGRKYAYEIEDADGELCPVADGTIPPQRGFGGGYEEFPNELYTSVDCEKLAGYLKGEGVEKVYTSIDAGLYLCEFINYCSLAEAQRTAVTHEKSTLVLFVHVPDTNVISTPDATDALGKIIAWICSQ
ncbi:peptidase C15 pyroglutamyl peptidase I-like protein [Wolfiporia cocos MD-104 SS10]|uniref:Peptidase C15 pyroglutamyl peptidase I-like protein n=1 Tax=Wolfiporia cocos (strain MD-104) TaxID=742152 RepID=A0A2H3K3S0_WOLCO|nr:peptidase C15 pyroglutamyl peptidase I-like protein [Wolfiporia cocos MD-104 SS10]